MDDKLDGLDFEKCFLADLLAMIGDRLVSLHSFIDARDPEGNSDVFDPMEHLAGVGMVAAQRYLASVCKWLSISKNDAMKWGPQKKNVAVASIVNAAANYWKHVEDEDGNIRQATRDTLKEIGVNLESGYCVSNALYECGYKHLSEVMKDLLAWRDTVIEEAKIRNA